LGVDLSGAKRLARGKYAEKARRFLALVEPEPFARFGNSEAEKAALRAVVDAADAVKPIWTSRAINRRA
jgi:hypothetical protein